MSHSESKEPNPAHNPDNPELVSEPEFVSEMDIDQWLETLRRADRSLYNMMALEVWSIAKTMDGLLPGFWSRFMENRRISMKQFIQQKEAQNPASADSSDSRSEETENEGLSS